VRAIQQRRPQVLPRKPSSVRVTQKRRCPNHGALGLRTRAQTKEELGLDQFEGRSWFGLHHHAVLTMIAFAFLQHLRLTENKPAA
jgi:SRSO17 transposase